MKSLNPWKRLNRLINRLIHNYKVKNLLFESEILNELSKDKTKNSDFRAIASILEDKNNAKVKSLMSENQKT
jgi:hypothetical protein